MIKDHIHKTFKDQTSIETKAHQKIEESQQTQSRAALRSNLIKIKINHESFSLSQISKAALLKKSSFSGIFVRHEMARSTVRFFEQCDDLKPEVCIDSERSCRKEDKSEVDI